MLATAQNQTSWLDIGTSPLYAIWLVHTNWTTYWWAYGHKINWILIGQTLARVNCMLCGWCIQIQSLTSGPNITLLVAYCWACHTNQLNIEWLDISPPPLYAVLPVDTNSITYWWAKYNTTGSIMLGLWAQSNWILSGQTLAHLHCMPFGQWIQIQSLTSGPNKPLLVAYSWACMHKINWILIGQTLAYLHCMLFGQCIVFW